MFNAKEFLENWGLYSPCEIGIEDLEELELLDNETIRISTYCVNCEVPRVFTTIPRSEELSKAHSIPVRSNVFESPEEIRRRHYKQALMNLESRHLRFICAFDNGHNFEVLIKTITGSPDLIMKTGQYPSVADIEKPDIKKYSAILPEEYLKEYRRALGLFADGIGIGSFVYLRRIFEKLVINAFGVAKEAGKLTEDEFNFVDKEMHQRRMDGKIRILKGYLPDIIIENAGIYSVLSVGIHELSEEDCLKYFPVVDSGIQIMLDYYLEMKNRQKREGTFAKEIAKIKGEIK